MNDKQYSFSRIQHVTAELQIILIIYIKRRCHTIILIILQNRGQFIEKANRNQITRRIPANNTHFRLGKQLTFALLNVIY